MGREPQFMRIFMKKSLIFIGLFFIAGCASQQTSIPEAGNEAAKLFTVKCSTCHSLPHPRRNSYEQWIHLVGVMEDQMKHKEMPPLSAGERSGILEYLKKHSR